MAKKSTKSKRSDGGTATAEALLVIPVAYGNLSVGKDTVNLTLSVERRFLSPSAADRHLTAKRLTGSISAVSGNDNPDQQQLPGVEAEEIMSATFDVKSFRTTRRTISFGITFAITAVDVASLSHFAQGSGTLTVLEAAELPKPDKAQPSPAAEEGGDDSPE